MDMRDEELRLLALDIAAAVGRGDDPLPLMKLAQSSRGVAPHSPLNARTASAMRVPFPA